MNPVENLIHDAQALRKAGNWSEALKLYRQLWYVHREWCGVWEGWGYAQCLYKLKQYAQSLAQCEEALTVWPEYEPLRHLMAWCLYQIRLKVEKLPLDEVLSVLQKILDLSSVSDTYGPAIKAIFFVVDKCADEQEYERVLEYLALIDPEHLSPEPEKFQDASGKKRSLPSLRLRWYTRQSEALMQTGAVNPAAELCRRVLLWEGLSKDQRVWFERRLARCVQANGQLEEACTLYERILQFKQDWYLRKEYAALLDQCQKRSEALRQACLAALAPGEESKKLNLYLLLADWLSDQPKLAQAHRLLVLRLRQNHGWPLPEPLWKAAGCPNSLPTVTELLKQLKPFWLQNEPQKNFSMKRLRGKIHSVFPHGQAGFVRVDRSTQYYFLSRDFKGDLGLLKPGLSVSFELKQGFDRKKNQPAMQAYKLRPCDLDSISG